MGFSRDVLPVDALKVILIETFVGRVELFQACID